MILGKAVLGDHFLQTVSPGRVIRRRHADLSAKPGHLIGNLLMISGDNHPVSAALPGLLVNPLDHGFAGDILQRLARQASGRKRAGITTVKVIATQSFSEDTFLAGSFSASTFYGVIMGWYLPFQSGS